VTLRGGSWLVKLVIGLLAGISCTSWCCHASAQDLNIALSEAGSRAESAALEISELEAIVPSVERRLEKSSQRAAPVKVAAHGADQRVKNIKSEQRAARLAALANMTRLENEKGDAAEKHDEKVRTGLGFGLAALITAGIALAWSWFRASALVAWLTRLSLSQAIGFCVGGGLLMAIIGAAMSNASGIVGVLGVALFALGFLLANALVLARHSAEVQRGRSKPVLRHERLPRQVTQVTAGLLAALCLIGLGTAVFAGEAKSSEASAALRREAGAKDVRTPALARAERRAVNLGRQTSSLLSVAHADRGALRVAQRKLGHAETRLASAESETATFARHLAALSAREEREAQAEARRAEMQAEKETVETEEVKAEECDPNYSGCLDPNASDYDCAGGSGDGPLYTGTVEVLGVDHYGLDDDGDGIGCDP